MSRFPSSRRVAVLLYHHVGNPRPETRHLALTVTPERFRRQVQWLRWRGYKGITPAQWLAWRTTGERLPERPVLFTFDDAYADCATFAFPVLERFGFRSAIFVISGQVGGTTPWDGLSMMTMEQIRYWNTHGVEIGAHTRTHPDLTAASEEAVADEVAGSKEDLIKAGLSPLSFAYPYGSLDQRVQKSVERVFSLAFTCEEGLNDLRTDPLLLKRTMVQPSDTLLDIEFRARFGKDPLDWVRSRVRLRSRLSSLLRRLRLLAG
jgi:peptidoglycan/xylan/chitin deacetylase (PgdA/CDA1 family)